MKLDVSLSKTAESVDNPGPEKAFNDCIGVSKFFSLVGVQFFRLLITMRWQVYHLSSLVGAVFGVEHRGQLVRSNPLPKAAKLVWGHNGLGW